MSPLVSVALPTYQRSRQLDRAIRSVIDQDYESVELIISDNASTDGTQAVCEAYAERYPWARYIRRGVNIGPTANFESLRSEAVGEYFLFLGDDDWLGPGYLRRCVEFHERHPGYSLVSGRVRYHGTSTEWDEPHPITLEQDDPRERVIGFCRAVRANGVFYGVTPTANQLEVGVLRNRQGGDWAYVMGLAFLGKVKTLEDVVVHRSVGGATTSLAAVAASLGLSRFEAFAPQLAIIYWLVRDVAFESPVYAPLGRRRWALAARVGYILSVRLVPEAVVKVARRGARAAATRVRRTRAATLQGFHG